MIRGLFFVIKLFSCAKKSIFEQSIPWQIHKFSLHWFLNLISFALLWQNTWEHHLIGRKDLFWLTVSEISFHGHLAVSLFGLVAGQNMMKVHGRGNLFTLCQPGSEGREEGTGAPPSPSRAHILHWPNFLLVDLVLSLKSCYLSSVTGGEPDL
jgi:hypothetical protein